jgi:hypothetical protein
MYAINSKITVVPFRASHEFAKPLDMMLLRANKGVACHIT